MGRTSLQSSKVAAATKSLASCAPTLLTGDTLPAGYIKEAKDAGSRTADGLMTMNTSQVMGCNLANS